MLSRKDLQRKELVAGKRVDNRQQLEFAASSISELKCSHPEDVLIIARIGGTRVSCSLSLEIRDADPELDLIHLRVTTTDDSNQKANMEHEDGDSDDELEMDDHEERSCANIEREAILETLIEELDLVEESHLVLLPGRVVFHLNIIINVLQNDGSVLDAAFFGLVAALERFRLPKVHHDVTEDTLLYNWDELHSTGCLLRQRFVSSTFAVIGSRLLCGPSSGEEEVADAVILTVAGTGNSLAFLQVIEGSLPPGFIGLPYDELVEASASRRTVLDDILKKSPSEDFLIAESDAVHLRSNHLDR